MMEVKWTSEQQKVINTRNRNILVSAAAGSGKTAVLVARILERIMDPDNPIDIDRLLVVTFTNAAAAEMRERIRTALEQKVQEDPGNVHLQKQLVLVHNAKITTIHSFCLHVLRNHFQIAGIDPSFRIADPGEVLLMEQDAAKEVLDLAYEEADAEFLEFLEQFVTGKSDKRIEETLLQLYHFSQGQPWPQRWLRECQKMYDSQTEEDWLDEKHPWIHFIIEDTGMILSDAEEQIHQAIRISEEPDGPYPYVKALQSDLEMIKRLRKEDTYRSYAKAFFEMPSYARLSTKKDESIAEEKKAQVQAIRSDVKDALANLRKKYYYDRVEILEEEFRKSGTIIRVLTRLTIQMMNCLFEKKQEKNLLDFGDLEHLALQTLLVQKDDELVSSAAAKEYAENFEEIMIDEYQDSNYIQELILQSVSGKNKGARNLFMVGDVKQSIYRFRLARPELFMEKYHTYQKEGKEACRIDLHKNFRSRDVVLEGVNDLFRQIMTPKLGGIIYDADAALYPGAEFQPLETEVERVQLILGQADSQNRVSEEARTVGNQIQKIIGTLPVWDKEKEQYRMAEYRDIVILLRTVNGWAEPFAETLGEMGIPCFTGSQKGYFSTTEIRIVLSYLKILDNPMQDIPLAAVLHSAIGDFTEEDLAKIRGILNSKANYYNCCMEYQERGEDEALRVKLRHFFSVYHQLREKCSHTPVHLLLWEILNVTGFGEYAQALPGGNQRKANLDMLIEKAIAYEATSYRGLFHFVRYIENLKKYEVDYGEANTDSESADTVRIMSIHKSKGLEFPIVFVSGLGKQFNETDVRSRVVMHPEFGIGCDFVDTQLRVKQPTLLKRAVQQKTLEENLGEELRVLYVAMTRAKELLILTGTVTDLESKLEKWTGSANAAGETLSYSVLSRAGAYLDWVVPGYLRQPNADHLIRTIIEGENQEEESLQASQDTILYQKLIHLDPDICQDEDTEKYLQHVFTQSYSYEAEKEIIGKLSVSELKKLSHIPEEEDVRELYQMETVIPLIPNFRGEKEEITGAARGTVYHTFMENLDYSRKDQLELQLEELISCGKITPEESEVLVIADIERFLKTKSGNRIEQAAKAGQLYREKPFVLGVPANEIRSDWSSMETVLVQGIIDAWFIEENEIVVLDYKTDRVTHPQMLVDRYRAQLDYYARALERLIGLPVKQCIIYSFYLGRDIIL